MGIHVYIKFNVGIESVGKLWYWWNTNSQICGRVTGYQFGLTDAVGDFLNNINYYYVYGVTVSLVGLLFNM